MSETDFEGFLLPHIRDMEPYTPILPFEVLSRQLGRAPEDIVKLDANENPYGPARAVRAALAEYPFLHVYPDPEQRELRDALAGYVGVPAEYILTGQGADELLDLISRVFLAPGDAIVDCPPTFGMYSFDAGLAGAQVIRVPRRADFSVDVEAVEAAVVDGVEAVDTMGRVDAVNEVDVGGEPAGPEPIAGVNEGVRAGTVPVRPKLLFLTSPNNPDGSLPGKGDLERLLALPIMVVLDEAYVEFAGLECSAAGWVSNRRNLIVLRTFSKWAGIAGLRLGYGIFPPWLMPYLWQAKQPYNVNVAATVAGLASLAHRAEIWPAVEAIIRERDRLYEELRRVPYLEPYPSRANFVLCRVRGRDAAELKGDLAARGVLVRYFAKPGLENCIRVSAGRPQDTDALLAALRAVT